MHSDIKKPITSSFILLPKFIQLGVIQVSVGSVFDVFLSNGPVQRLWAGSGPETRTGFHLEKAGNRLMVTVFAAMAIRLLVG